MYRKQLEKIYEVNGLTEYKLKTTEDLLRVHGIDYTEVDGYSRLDDLNKKIYERFIINFFNAWGLDSRLNLVPKGIYFVEEIEFLVKKNPSDEYFTFAGGQVLVIDKSGVKSIHKHWLHEDYKALEITEGEPQTYLRFEYQHGTDANGNPRNEWLHVIKDGKEWY